MGKNSCFLKYTYYAYYLYSVLCLATEHLVVLICDSKHNSPPGSSVHGVSPSKNIGVDCQALLQGISPTQGLNPGLLHCRWILYWLSHQGSPRILEWKAYPFSRGSFQPRNQTRVSRIAGGLFTSWATREAQLFIWIWIWEHFYYVW